MRLALIMFLAVGCAGIWTEAFGQKHSEKFKSSDTMTQRGTRDAPVIVEIHSTEDEKRSKDAVLESNRKVANFTDKLSKYTLCLVVVGALQVIIIFWQVRIVRAQNKANELIERAYVKISHFPPGLNDIVGTFWLNLQIKNYGNTPAKVTDVLVKPIILSNNQPLPRIPDYSRKRDEDTPKAFLVTNDEFSYSELFRIPEQIKEINDGTLKLYVIGYVDYIDIFGVRYRAGYGRVYKPGIDERAGYSSDDAFYSRNNLIFVTQDEYNYDRKRKNGEGNDWH